MALVLTNRKNLFSKRWTKVGSLPKILILLFWSSLLCQNITSLASPILWLTSINYQPTFILSPKHIVEADVTVAVLIAMHPPCPIICDLKPGVGLYYREGNIMPWASIHHWKSAKEPPFIIQYQSTFICIRKFWENIAWATFLKKELHTED